MTAGALLTGTALAILGGWWTRESYRRTAVAQYQAAAENRISAVNREVIGIPLVLSGLREIFALDAAGRGAEFERFGRGMSGALPSHLGLYWLAPAAGDGWAVMRRSCPDAPCVWTPQSKPAAIPAIARALEDARVTRQLRLTARFSIGSRHHVAMVEPVFREGSPKPSGFLLALLTPEFLVESALGYLRPSGVEVYLYDVSSRPSEFLYHHRSRASRRHAAATPPDPDPDGGSAAVPHIYSGEFDLAGRRWSVRCLPAPGVLDRELPQPWLVLLGGLLLSCAGAFAFHAQVRRIAGFEKQVEERTRELSLMNRELAVARDAAVEASRVKSNFLANISHEVRTPLNGIVGMTTFLLDSPLTPEQKENASVVMECSRSLLALMNDLLDLTKIEAGRMDVASEPFDLVELVERTADMVADNARVKRLRLDLDFAPDVPAWVRGDPARVRQVLLNLAANAVKFTDAGFVSIRVEQIEEGRIRFSVEDSGIGIDGAWQQDVFRRFTQVDSSPTRRHGGAGLGLAIARQLVELMSGEIGVRSSLGGGATFWFTLPLAAAPAEPGTDPGTPAGDILLATAEPATARLLRYHGIAAGIAIHELPNPWTWKQEAVAPGRTWLAVVVDESFIPVPCPGINVIGLGFGRGGGVEWLRKPVHRAAFLASLRAGPPQPSCAPAADAPPTGESLRVLLAEDNAVNQHVAVRMLQKLNCAVSVASSGLEAVERYRELRPDLVFMDCQMPRMDGFEATGAIRALETGGRRTPIIALTANVMAGDRDRCLAAGMDGYLGKPLDLSALAEALRLWSPVKPSPLQPEPGAAGTPAPR